MSPFVSQKRSRCRWPYVLGSAALLALAGSALLLGRYCLSSRTGHERGELPPPLRGYIRELAYRRPWWDGRLFYVLGKVPGLGSVWRSVQHSEVQRLVDGFNAQQRLIAMGTNAWPAIPNLFRLLDTINGSAFDVLVGIHAENSAAFSSLPQPISKRLTDLAASIVKRPLDANSAISSPSGVEPLARHLFALQLLKQMHAVKVLPVLARALAQHDDHAYRCRIAQTIGSFHRAGDAAAPSLIARLKDESEWADVRAASAAALGELGWSRAKGILRVSLHDHFGIVRTEAAGALWELGEPLKAIQPTLQRDLHHPLASVRCATLRRVAEIDPAGVAFGDEIKGAREDPNAKVRKETARLFGNTEPMEP